MSFTLKEGRVLLIGGPAAVVVRAGVVSILGADLAAGRRVVVRRGKALPLQALGDSTLELTEGEGSARTELQGSTIPESWTRVAKEISTHRPSPVMVLGAADRGKNTFCIYLSNMILKEGGSVTMVDGDVGQGDIGPPTSISMALVEYPLFDLFALRPEEAIFIGSTTPSGVQNRVLEAISTLLGETDKKRPSLTLINTDGWVIGDDAAEYKLRLLALIAPQAVVGIQLEGELEPILSVAEYRGHQVFRVEPSSAVRERDRDVRRGLREQCYRKFLSGAIMRKFPIGRLRTEYTFLSSPEVDDTLRDLLSKLLHRPVLVYADTYGGLRVLVKGSEEVEEQTALRASQMIGKPLRFVAEDEAKGLLLGLMEGRGRFLGLGILKGIDFERRSLEVLTPCLEAPSIIRFGRIRLDEEFREIGFTQVYEP
jgi:polynucleotide 5'-hydroxyl-kinase GRC3/NOL9